MTRYYEVIECTHGEVDAHEYEHVHGGHAGNVAPEVDIRPCPGGVRRELTIDYIAARDWLKHKHNVRMTLADAQAIVQAALGDPS